MPAFILAIFLSAFLLFQVQPIVARYILPWYGGSPGVWTTCMLCFQFGLLGGYAYAHGLVSFLRKHRRAQVGIHLALLVVSFAMLPITPDESLKPTGDESPVWGIVILLLSTVGLPYIVISASGPLLQHWFAEASGGKSPYRLYAVSNFGSLLGLVSYPFLFERKFGLSEQTWLWSGGYAGYGLLAFICAIVFLNKNKLANAKAPAAADSKPEERPGWINRILWIALPTCGSVLLLATTSQMSQDVAVVPFLWVLPLGLYLVTFIISFDHSRWYNRAVWIPLTTVSVAALVYLLNQDFASSEMHLALQIGIYVSAMFCACMICHGEMVRLKPEPSRLTSFYLAISLGGALGGAFVSLLAPRIFDGYWELHFGLIGLVALTTFCIARDSRKPKHPFLLGAGAVLWVQAAVVMVVFLQAHVALHRAGVVTSVRGFYGVLRVWDGWDGEVYYKTLYNGRIAHGSEYFSGELKGKPTSYYTEKSAPGLFFQYHPKRTGPEPEPMKIGVIGLGVGTIAAFAQPGDSVRFYEINTQCEQLARQQFGFLNDCQGAESVVLGDARVSLARELAEGDVQNFDVLFVDAFSGDSIPLHLLTRESFELYFNHINPDGVLVVHITNLHLDLSDPVRVLAADAGKRAVHIEHWPEEYHANSSDWVLITNNDALLDDLDDDGWVSPWEREEPKDIRWTDDHSDLASVVVGDWPDLLGWFKQLLAKK